MNKIEAYKQEKDGLDVLHDLPRFVAEGWESIGDGDRERLKWLGVFLRRPTPGRLMMRVRMPNGMSNSGQFRALADVSDDFGKGFLDITTRQQVQLRWFGIENVPQIWARLEQAGLTSLQTGMDNIRNVVGCPMAGLTPNELLDASQVVRELTGIFLGNKEFTNLPRKLNVAITGCIDGCTHTGTQDISLTPAVREVNATEVKGFNVAVGGKMGSGGYRPATPLDVFVTPREAARVCAEIILLFRDHGSREARNKCRLAFLVEEWGAARFRYLLEMACGFPLLPAGRPAERSPQSSSASGTGSAGHTGVMAQAGPGLKAAGLVVPVGRMTAHQLREAARLADTYGDGEIRITTGQNVIIPNVPEDDMPSLLAEPLLLELPVNPPEVMRGLVACTGKDYCHFSLIETKELAIKTARSLASSLGKTGPLSMRWSGCPNGCGNHLDADIGILGKRAKIGGEVVDAVDIFLNLPNGLPNAETDGLGEGQSKPGQRIENVPCNELPQVLEEVIRKNAGLATHA